jgi:peroxiredoxin
MPRDMKILLIFFVTFTFALTAHAQTSDAKTKRELNEKKVVIDSSGIRYPYAVWRKMVLSGDYKLKRVDPKSDSTSYLLVKTDSLQKERELSRESKPKESPSFTDGEKIRPFNATDINGNKINLTDLEGKVVVLCFWFVKGPTSQQEIPELNKIAAQYANDPNVVFIAFALDKQRDIQDYIEGAPFTYHLVEDSRVYARMYNVHKYPTNVVLDKEGKVLFNSKGYKIDTAYWIKKSIEEAEK